jgi:hypothetical protein
VVPIILEEPASGHYEDGDLVAYLVSIDHKTMPAPRGIQ